MFDVFVMDMGGQDANLTKIKDALPHAVVMRYFGTHLSMINKTASLSRTEWFWIISSQCVYDDFDFHWYPPVGQEYQIHCWASGNQKQGDTFLVNVSNFKAQRAVEHLGWYRDINYHENGVERLPWPILHMSGNDLASVVSETVFDTLYVQISMNGSVANSQYSPSLWEKRDFIAFDTQSSVSLCPRDAKLHIESQIFDYPYILCLNDQNTVQKTQDVVFISYDEKNADFNWERLLKKAPNAIRIHGVTGIMEAMKAAAGKVTTPWFYAVFGKTEVADTFQFNHCPNYLQHPANYIFHAYNPILDYAYGHGAIVMYDTEWVRNVTEFDIDFTMAHHTVVVPEISCINRVDIDPWAAWRTSFREVYKLCYLQSISPSDENKKHLERWLTMSLTENGKWSQLAAQDAYVMFNAGETVDINDWKLLRSMFDSKTP